jgi:hypothetical protein
MVTLAVQLMWTAMALSILNLFFGWDEIMGFSEIPAEERIYIRGFVAALLVGSFALYIWVIVKMGQGRNWARVVLVVLQVLSLLANPFAQIEDFGVFVWSLGVLAFLVEVAAIVLIYLPASRPWFQARAEA